MPLYDDFFLKCAGRSPLWSSFASEKNPEIEYMLLSVLHLTSVSSAKCWAILWVFLR